MITLGGARSSLSEALSEAKRSRKSALSLEWAKIPPLFENIALLSYVGLWGFG